MPVMPVQWKLKELLAREGVTPYALSEQMGGASRRPALYGLTSPDPEKRPTRIGLPLLGEILSALRELTGKQFSVADVLEDEAYTAESGMT